jgi:ketosteroid isomerase-like protein
VGTALDTVNRFYDITNNRKGEGLDALVAQNVTFAGPIMQATGAEQYLALNAQLLPFHQETRMLAQFEHGNDVCSIYEMDMSSPKGERLTLTLADWVRVEHGRITEQRIYFDPRRFAAAFEM